MDADAAARARRAPSPSGANTRRYRAHELALPDGARLRLHADGKIERRDAGDALTGSWAPGDPEWASHAIRFGLRPEPITVAPQGERIENNRLP